MKNGVVLKSTAKGYYYPGERHDKLTDAFADTARRRLYLGSKRLADILISLACLPVLLGICCVLLCLNPFWNPGRLFFLQRRCGQNRQGFTMVKFRTMTYAGAGERGADDPLDTGRITPLGHFMRDSKLDELPQILNVLMGQMSLIGPRPEIFSFAETYRAAIPGYGMRETVRPGMSGYAQVVQGYTDSIELARQKTELDTYYVRNMGWRLDLFVLVATLKIVFGWRVRP